MVHLLFSGSLRKGSFNRKLIHVASRICSSLPDTDCMVADLQALAIPVYDGDIEAKSIPEGVLKLCEWIDSAQALIVSSPEYNGSIAGSFKNAIDWVSRVKPVPLAKKPVLLMGASPGPFGAVSGMLAGRVPLERLGSYVYPHGFALPKANEAFNEDGDLIKEESKQRLVSLISDFDKYARQLSVDSLSRI